MTGVGEPLDDRPQALRHAGGRIADAVIVDEQKAHDRSVADGEQPTSTRAEPVNPRSIDMSQEMNRQTNCSEQTQQLLQGPLKHIRRRRSRRRSCRSRRWRRRRRRARSCARRADGVRHRLATTRTTTASRMRGEPGIDDVGRVLLGDGTTGRPRRARRLLRRSRFATASTRSVSRSRPARRRRRRTSGSDDTFDSDGMPDGAATASRP